MDRLLFFTRYVLWLIVESSFNTNYTQSTRLILRRFWRLFNKPWSGFKWDLVRKCFPPAVTGMNNGSGWIELCLMAPFPYGCLDLTQFPKYLFHDLSRNVHSPSFLDSGFLSQTYFKNKAGNGISPPPINQVSALKSTTSNLPFPVHLVFHLNLYVVFQNASSLALPFWTLLLLRPNLGSTFLPWNPQAAHPSSFALTELNFIQSYSKLPYTCVSYLSKYLWVEDIC